MWIVNLTANSNGSHNDHRGEHIAAVPDGWAMIPEDFAPPSSFPFVSIEAAELTFTREVEVEKEVTKTREVEAVDENGNTVTVTEEYTERETVTEERPYTVMTVTAMTAGEVPEVEETETVTQLDVIEAQVYYTAMMTDTLLEE